MADKPSSRAARALNSSAAAGALCACLAWTRFSAIVLLSVAFIVLDILEIFRCPKLGGPSQRGGGGDGYPSPVHAPASLNLGRHLGGVQLLGLLLRLATTNTLDLTEIGEMLPNGETRADTCGSSCFSASACGSSGFCGCTAFTEELKRLVPWPH